MEAVICVVLLLRTPHLFSNGEHQTFCFALQRTAASYKELAAGADETIFYEASSCCSLSNVALAMLTLSQSGPSAPAVVQAVIISNRRGSEHLALHVKRRCHSQRVGSRCRCNSLKAASRCRLTYGALNGCVLEAPCSVELRLRHALRCAAPTQRVGKEAGLCSRCPRCSPVCLSIVSATRSVVF